MPQPEILLSDVRFLIVEDEVLVAMMVEGFVVQLGCSSFRQSRP